MPELPAPGGVSLHARDRVARDVPAELREGGERCGVERVDALREVLLQRRGERHRVRRLVRLVARQRRAVRAREGGEADRDDEEGDRDRTPSRVARERDRGQAQRDDRAARRALEQAQDRRQQPDADDGGDERDQAREQQEEDAGSPLLGDRRRVGAAADESEDDGDERADRGDVDRGDRERPDAPAGPPEREQQHERRGGGQPGGGRDACPREHGVLEHGAGRRAGRIGDRCGDRGSHGPADDRPRERDHDGLGREHEPPLAAARAEPGQSLHRRLVAAAAARGGEQRECEQQRRRLAADQEQAPAGDRARVARRLHGVGRSLEPEELGRRLELGLCLRHARLEAADAPGVDVAALERDDPAVRAVEGGRERGGRERRDAVRDQDRDGLGGVVGRGLLDGGVQLLADVAPECEVGDERPLPDDDEVQLGVRGHRAVAADLDQLAAAARARSRIPARAETHPVADAFDRGQVGDRAADRALAKDGRCERRAVGELPERLRRDRVEHREPLRGLAGHAAPRCPQDALRRIELLEVATERPVLRDEAPAQHCRQSPCPDRDAEPD